MGNLADGLFSWRTTSKNPKLLISEAKTDQGLYALIASVRTLPNAACLDADDVMWSIKIVDEKNRCHVGWAMATTILQAVEEMIKIIENYEQQVDTGRGQNEYV